MKRIALIRDGLGTTKSEEKKLIERGAPRTFPPCTVDARRHDTFHTKRTMGDLIKAFEAKKEEFDDWLKSQPPAVRERERAPPNPPPPSPLPNACNRA